MIFWQSAQLPFTLFITSFPAVCNPPCVNGACSKSTFTCDCENNFEGSDCNVPSMCAKSYYMYTYVCLDSILTSFTFPQFAVQHVSMEYAMLLHSLVTVQTTSKALTAVHPVCISLCVCVYPPSNLLHTLTVCNPPCVNGTCSETTFTCDCMNNFEGSDCNTPSMYYMSNSNASLQLIAILSFVFFFPFHSL